MSVFLKGKFLHTRGATKVSLKPMLVIEVVFSRYLASISIAKQTHNAYVITTGNAL